MSEKAEAYRKLGEEMEEHRSLLVSAFGNIQKEFDGDAKWANIIDAEREATFLFWDHTENARITIDNAKDFIVPYPAPDSWFQTRYGGDWHVTHHERLVQPAAKQAQEDIAKADEDATNLDLMTESDIDALISIPEALAVMIEHARSGRSYFETTKDAIIERADAKNKDKDYWVGDGSQAYVNALNLQIPYFEDSGEDMTTIEDCCIGVGDAVSDIAQTISKMYQARIDAATGLINECISIATNPYDWAGYASKIVSAIGEAAKKHAEEFEQKVKELANLEKMTTLVDKAQNIRIDNWVSPAEGEFSG